MHAHARPPLASSVITGAVVSSSEDLLSLGRLSSLLHEVILPLRAAFTLALGPCRLRLASYSSLPERLRVLTSVGHTLLDERLGAFGIFHTKPRNEQGLTT